MRDGAALPLSMIVSYTFYTSWYEEISTSPPKFRKIVLINGLGGTWLLDLWLSAHDMHHIRNKSDFHRNEFLMYCCVVALLEIYICLVTFQPTYPAIKIDFMVGWYHQRL